MGERLPAEAELARQFEVSRSTIREALQSLWAEGLIRKIPGAGGGSFVESVDHRSPERAMQQSLHRLLQLGTLRPAIPGRLSWTTSFTAWPRRRRGTGCSPR